jgi:hypothetical protein
MLDPWQQFVLEHGLGERADGKWSALEVGLGVPRQNGKGGVLEALELFWLFLAGDRLILHSAHEFKTAKEGYLRVRSLIENTPDLDRRVKQYRQSNEDTSIELLNGARLRFVARSGGSGRGFSGDKVILDEAMFLSPGIMAALLPTLSARANPQIWYTGSAGFLTSHVWRSVRDRGIAGEDRLAYFEWSADPEANLDDRAEWMRANPAWGLRINEEFCQLERSAMPEAEFALERLGIWEDPSTSSPFGLAWPGLANPNSTTDGPLAFGFDVNPEHTRSSIGACGPGAGALHLELTSANGSYDNRPGTAWVVPRLLELRDKFKPVAIAWDSSGPAGSLKPEIEATGLEVVDVTGREMGQACGALHDDVIEGRVQHLGQAPLTAAVLAARKQHLGDAWKWARRDATDISPLVAVTLARHGFVAHQGQAAEAMVVWA